MAAGDVTLDNDTLTVVGDRYQIQGTVEVSTTAAEAVIASSGYILSFMLEGNEDDVDVALPRTKLNVGSDFSTASNGSVAIDGSAGAPDTLRFTAQFR